MVFVTGGAGYVGFHTCVELLNAGMAVTLFYNFCNSRPKRLGKFLNVWGNDYDTPDGTGVGYSVLQMVHAFEQASGRLVPCRVGPRRAGDIAACYADASLALALLGLRAQRDLSAMCADAWRWQSGNPNGYKK